MSVSRRFPHAGSRKVSFERALQRPAPIGHNGGPPLDMSWSAWIWRRAHAAAWKKPKREIMMLRLRQAERLGLDYNAYTSALLDRGARLCGVVVMLSDELGAQEEDKLVSKLATLKDCTVALSGDGDHERLATRIRGAGGRVDQVLPSRDRASFAGALRRLAASVHASPGAFFMVGTSAAECDLAETSGLGLFMDAVDYFGL